MHRVVVTGVGVASPLGCSIAEFTEKLFAGHCAIGPVTFTRPTGSITYRGAQVENFDASQHVDARKLSLMDRFSHLAVAAARQAWAQANIQPTPEFQQQCAVILGTGVGGQITMEEAYDRMWGNPTASRVHPLSVPRLMANANTSQVSMDLGLQGPGFTIASACASSTHAIGTAYHMVRSGMVRAAMTGGSEATLTLGCLKGWEALRVMSPDFCRPFSKGRQGMVLGEGAGCLMLERMDDATARGAKILAEMIGFGQSCDARDITTPDQGGMMRALQNALHDAGVEPTQVVHINAHGTGTRANDTTESAALKDVFGDHLHGMKTTANKSLFGHALGAAGALEMVATVLSLHHQRVPPTLHFVEPDPDCALVPITTTTETLPQGAIAIKNSFAFGGLNAVLVVRGC